MLHVDRDDVGIGEGRQIDLPNAGRELRQHLGRDLQRQKLVGSITGGIVPPRSLVEATDRYRSERRVAEMAADNMTNKDIAQALFVTPKTVEAHVSAVLRKLQLSTRHQLTRWAAERRLA